VRELSRIDLLVYRPNFPTTDRGAIGSSDIRSNPQRPSNSDALQDSYRKIGVAIRQLFSTLAAAAEIFINPDHIQWGLEPYYLR